MAKGGGVVKFAQKETVRYLHDLIDKETIRKSVSQIFPTIVEGNDLFFRVIGIDGFLLFGDEKTPFGIYP